MNEQATRESTGTREGKTYGYQQPQGESATGGHGIADCKQNLVSAFEQFIDSLSVPAKPAAPGAGTGTGAAGGAAAPVTTGGGTPGGGTPGYGTPATGGPAGAGTIATPPGGEAPVGEAARAALEAASIFSQREAYRRDRERESARRSNRLRESSASSAAPGVLLLGPASKHQSDSNRSPLQEAKEYAPAFGMEGKAPGVTIERMSVPATRPETVPAPLVVPATKPIDAYYASFGTAIERAAVRARVEQKALEVIIGTDDRVRVTNNTLYPWRCICSLLITAQNGAQYVGTGWLVGPRLVLTAGHCVYMSDEGGWASQIEVIPGRNATQRPYGSAISRELRSVTGWTQDNDSNCDYGAILLPADKRYGDQLGWFGYAVRQDDYLRQITLNLSGYPGDGGKTGIDGTQWFHSRRVMDVMERQITYDIDTYGGQSGAPVWEMTSNGSRYGVGIHTWGTSVNNGATRITREVFDNIVRWNGE